MRWMAPARNVGRPRTSGTARIFVAVSTVLMSAASLDAQEVSPASGRPGEPGAGFSRAWIAKANAIRSRRTALEERVGPALTTPQLIQSGASLTGVLAVPVIAGLPSDGISPVPASDYQNRLFGSGPTYSAKTYYEELSRSVFRIDGVVTDWVDLPKASADYWPNPADPEDRFGDTAAFLQDGLTLTDGALDFGGFDNDGPDGVPNSGDDDGYADVVAFIYPEVAKTCGGAGIWPHRWVFRGWGGAPFTTNDPSANGGFILVDDYVIQSAVTCARTAPMNIGTFAHELGHAIGLPDLYDTDANLTGDSEGIGHWGLMGAGSWNSQDSPAHMSAWSKDFLGWVDVTSINGPQSEVWLEPIYDNGRVLRYDLPSTEEHFLLENRQRTGSDRKLPGPGLLVWHIDRGVISTNRLSNRVNADETRKGVDLEEADGLADLDSGQNRGDAGDAFPGSASNSVFSLATLPSSSKVDGGNSGFEIGSIRLSGSNVGFDVISAGPPITTVAWINGDTVRAADTVKVTLRVSVSDPMVPIGSLAADLLFDPAVLAFVSLEQAEFQGTLTPNLGQVGTGVIRIAGVNTNAEANRDTTAVAVITFVASGLWGVSSPLDLSVSEMNAVDFSDLAEDLSILDGQVLVSPGTLAITITGAGDVSASASRRFAVTGDLTDLEASVGAMAGRFTIDPLVVRVDSVFGAGYGGTLDANLAMQSDSGFVRFAVVNTNPPLTNLLDFFEIWLTGVGSAGDTSQLTVQIDELSDNVRFQSLLPFISQTTGLTVVVRTGTWGDINGDQRVTALDALICLSSVVGKDVSQFDPGAEACDVAPSPSFGSTTALDALAILSHVVGKTLPDGFRVGEPR
jgi:M6 family metalloprotease-like protein